MIHVVVPLTTCIPVYNGTGEGLYSRGARPVYTSIDYTYEYSTQYEYRYRVTAVYTGTCAGTQYNMDIYLYFYRYLPVVPYCTEYL